MLFKNFLQNTAAEIDQDLELFFNNWSTNIEQLSSRLTPLGKALYEACRGGKRIRGSLVILAYGLVLENTSNDSVSSLRPGKEILSIAVAYEIFQASILAHDDVIDKSLTRRGAPSLYAGLGGGHAGISKAICLADIGFFLAFNIMAKSAFPNDRKNSALEIFSQTMLDTGLGELLDVELGDTRSAAEKDILKVYELKTAYYTFTAPLLLGAVLAGQKKEEFKSLINFGQNIGIAFQIQDDINDIFSDKIRMGKDIGGDIKEGKQTLLYAYAAGHAGALQKKILKKYYGNPQIGTSEIDLVKNALNSCGALEFARKEADKYVEKAKAMIPEITTNKEYFDLLREMTEHFKS